MTDGLIGVSAPSRPGPSWRSLSAIGLSPLAPFGAVRPLYPDSVSSFDWTVLGLGFAASQSWCSAPHRSSWRTGPSPHRRDLVRRRSAERAPTTRCRGGARACRLGDRLRPTTCWASVRPLGLGCRARCWRRCARAILGAVLVAVVVVVTSITSGRASLRWSPTPRSTGGTGTTCSSGRLLGGRGPAGGRRPLLLDHDPKRGGCRAGCTSRT